MMRILIAYDGSQSADVAIATASELLAVADPEAIVLTIWEPMLVTALHATPFGVAMPAMATDMPDVDGRCEQEARRLAEHGAWLARRHGFDATPAWVADDHDVATTILAQASKSDVDLVVLGARGPRGHPRVSRKRLQSRPPALLAPRPGHPRDLAARWSNAARPAGYICLDRLEL